MMNSLQDKAIGNQIRKNSRCLYCGQFAGIVWVHGHGQCSACGTNVDECCRGESCEMDTPRGGHGLDLSCGNR